MKIYDSNKDYKEGCNATFFFKNQIEYASIPKHYLKDKKLSMKAKGMLTIIYSLPDEWDYNMEGLSYITALSLKQLRTILKELEFFRYIERERKQDKKGKFIYHYWIYIEPREFIDEEEEENWMEEYLNSPYYQKWHTVKGKMDFYL